MSRPGKEAGLKLVQGGYGGLRGWIDQVEHVRCEMHMNETIKAAGWTKEATLARIPDERVRWQFAGYGWDE